MLTVGFPMRKILVYIVILVLCAAAVFQFAGNVQESPDGLTLAEATFSMRKEDTKDCTSFLVGKFISNDGTKLEFDGCGNVLRYETNLTKTSGSYSLTEAADGAAIVRMDLGSGPALYSFQITSPDGEITLIDSANISHIFTPVAN